MFLSLVFVLSLYLDVYTSSSWPGLLELGRQIKKSIVNKSTRVIRDTIDQSMAYSSRKLPLRLVSLLTELIFFKSTNRVRRYKKQ